MKIFNFKHLQQVEESYYVHFKFGVWSGLILMLLGTLSMFHAVFPFMFSRSPDRLYNYFVKRAQARLDRVDATLASKNLYDQIHRNQSK